MNDEFDTDKIMRFILRGYVTLYILNYTLPFVFTVELHTKSPGFLLCLHKKKAWGIFHPINTSYFLKRSLFLNQLAFDNNALLTVYRAGYQCDFWTRTF